MFKEEKIRISTFLNYPKTSKISSLLLANSGFIYVGDGQSDTVTCVSCNATKSDWKLEESVEDFHQKLSPHCAMLTQNKEVNIPFVPRSITKSSFSVTDFNSSTLDINKTKENLPNEKFKNCTNHSHYINSESITNNVRKVSTHVLSSNEAVVQSLIQSQEIDSSKVSNSTIASNYQISMASKEKKDPIMEKENAAQINSSVPASHKQSQADNNQIFKTSTQSTLQTDLKKDQNMASKENKVPTYSDLGIITERPKFQNLSLKSKRIETFEKWPKNNNFKVEDLAEAGFYFAGYGDCARCFYCAGGLRNWEIGDDIWVEHARWFPKCAFVRQQLGQIFINAVQDLSKTHAKIPFQTVKDHIQAKSWSVQFEKKANPLKQDPAVQAMIEYGFLEQDVLVAAECIKKETAISADVLLQHISSQGKLKRNYERQQEVYFPSSLDNKEMINQIKEKNMKLREQTLCKICMDSEVEIVFLPCGHFVSCKDCAIALNNCPVCRVNVKGMVRTFLG